MKPKRRLRKWVRIALLMIPEIIIICELFFVGLNLRIIISEINNKQESITCVRDYQRPWKMLCAKD